MFLNIRFERKKKDIATLIMGEAGDLSYDDWRENMDAVAILLINLPHFFRKFDSPYDAAMSKRFSGYKQGKKYEGKYEIAWDYAYELATYLLTENYSKINCPEGMTDRHISMWYEDTFNSKQCPYYYLAESPVYIGDNVFYAEKGQMTQGDGSLVLSPNNNH